MTTFLENSFLLFLTWGQVKISIFLPAITSSVLLTPLFTHKLSGDILPLFFSFHAFYMNNAMLFSHLLLGSSNYSEHGK